MQFSYLTAIASTLVAASALQLKAVSSSSDVNDAGVSSIHEGAAINYVQLGNPNNPNNGESYEYDGSQGTITNDLGGVLSNAELGFGPSSDKGAVLIFGAYSTTGKFTFDSEKYLEVNGSADNFYACKNINDPYSYSERTYFVLYSTTELTDDCESVKLQQVGSGSNSTSASSTGVAPAATSTTAVVVGAAAIPTAAAAAFGAAAMAMLL